MMRMHADIRMNCGLTDRMAEMADIESDRITIHVGRYYYNHRRPIDAEHLDMPIHINDEKVGVCQISLYTGLITEMHLYSAPMYKLAPMGNIQRLMEWSFHQEGEPIDPEVYIIARGFCVGDVVRLSSQYVGLQPNAD